MKHLLLDYVLYNYWANNRLVNRLAQAADALLEQTGPSSYPSIRKTLLHIWDAEQMWLGRMQGVSLPGFPSEVFDGELVNILGGVTKTSAEFVDFVEHKPEEFFVTLCDYKTTDGKPQRHKHAQFIHHCMNHSSYHRGQITTIAHHVGINALPNTDYITYIREKD